MANRRIVSEPVDVPDVAKDATPMERLTAFARRIVHVPKEEIGEHQEQEKASPPRPRV